MRPTLALVATISLLVLSSPSPGQAECPLGKPRIYYGGEPDGFVPPTEPTHRRPFFDTGLPVTWKDFDDATPNQAWGHTLENLPSDIVRAELTIRMRPHFGGSDNDSLNLGFVEPGQFLYGSRVHSLPGASPATGGTWSPEANGTTEFRVDLGTLPQGIPILAALNTDRFLDVYVQDDTEVDWVQLAIWSCPPLVRWGDRPDGFAPPASGNQRRQALGDRFPTVNWKGFDDATSNRAFGYSFLNLPDDVVRARLTLRLTPHSDVPSNDQLLVGLVGPNPQFLFTTSIEDLPEAGGSWENGEGPTTFTLELGDLPAGAALLASINQQNLLDIYIQDDTAVDFFKLELWICPPKTTVSGFPYGILGTGVLTSLPNSEEFELSGLERVGIDGVEIDLDGADGFCIGTGMLCVGDGGIGTAAELAVMGTIDNDTPDEFSTLLLENTGSEVRINADFRFSDELMDVKVLRDGQVVALHTTATDGPAATVPLDACFTELDWYLLHETTGPADPNTYCYRLFLKDETPVDILQGGPGGVLGDKIEICPPLIQGQLPPMFRLSSLRLTARGLDSIDLTPSALRAFETTVRSIGTSRLSATAGGVAISGISRDGGQGVAFDLPNARSSGVALDPYIHDEDQPGSHLQVAASGVLDGVPDQSLGTLRITRTEIGLEARADFTDLDTSTQRVQVLRDGVVVHDSLGRAGEGILTSAWPIGLGKLDSRTECYVGTFPPETLFTLPPVKDPSATVGAIAGDELRVLAEGTEGRVGSKSELSITAGGLGDLSLGKLTTATTCVPSETRLCLNGGRFAVEADWRTPRRRRGQAQAVSLTDDTGYFWFFDEDNVEMVVKALEGCPANDRFWIFAGGLTNVEVDVRVLDTETGDVRTYKNPQGEAYQPLQDTSAFATCSAGAMGATSLRTWEIPQDLKVHAGQEATSLMLNDGRFRVEARWRRPSGATGVGQAVQLTDDTGYFWFFRETNVEVVLKVLRGCAANGRFWVFAGGLTNVEVELTVTDTQSGQVKSYTNPLGTAFQPLQDTRAFPTCP